MTEQVYPEPLRSFVSDQAPAPVVTVPVVSQGRAALEEANKVSGRASCWRGGLTRA
jgi:phosphoribosylformylglycinamidine synthase